MSYHAIAWKNGGLDIELGTTLFTGVRSIQ